FDVAVDVPPVALQRGGTHRWCGVLLQPAVQPLAQGHFTFLTKVHALIFLHTLMELFQQLFLCLSRHIAEDGAAVVLMTDDDAALPAAILPSADHAVPRWSALSHVFIPPFSFPCEDS